MMSFIVLFYQEIDWASFKKIIEGYLFFHKLTFPFARPILSLEHSKLVFMSVRCGIWIMNPMKGFTTLFFPMIKSINMTPSHHLFHDHRKSLQNLDRDGGRGNRIKSISVGLSRELGTQKAPAVHRIKNFLSMLHPNYTDIWYFTNYHIISTQGLYSLLRTKTITK